MAARLMKEWKDLEENQLPGVSVSLHDGNTHLWDVVIDGPPGTPYEGGKFKFQIVIPDQYPHKAPDVIFQTKIYSPAVREDEGKIHMCVELLQKWAPAAKIRRLLADIYDVFVHPSGQANAEAALVLMEKPDQFRATAQEWTRLYAKG